MRCGAGAGVVQVQTCSPGAVQRAEREDPGYLQRILRGIKYLPWNHIPSLVQSNASLRLGCEGRVGNMFVRRGQEGARQMIRAAVHCLSVPRDRLGAISRLKWTSSLGSGFDGSSFSDEEDSPYDEARRMRFEHGEPGSVTLKGNEVDFIVDEFNRELDSIFGAAPPSELETSTVFKREPALERVSPATTVVSDDRGMRAADREVFPEAEMFPGADRRGFERSSGVGLSHVDSAGKAAMVNVVAKTVTARVAIASGRVLLGSDAFSLVAANSISKGDVLTVAKIAGIMGAKQTASFIPLCHPLPLSGVDLSLTLNEELQAVDIEAKVATVGPTGVEMEALTAVAVASLTVYDMCKAVTKDIRISEVRLESKTGGKSGDWSRRRS